MLIAPMPPLLFMGEEWGSTQPFPFFCDFQGDLAQAVRKGRREEFKAAYAKYGDEIPDPLAESTFKSAVLDWEARATVAGSRRLALVRDLLAVRHQEIVPLLRDVTFGSAHVDGPVLSASWRLAGGRSLMLLANLSAEPARKPAKFTPERTIWGDASGDDRLPWAVAWSLGTG